MIVLQYPGGPAITQATDFVHQYPGLFYGPTIAESGGDGPVPPGAGGEGSMMFLLAAS